MYHSYQLYTGNMGLSYCILGMSNLIRYVQVPVKYKSFWKIISIKSAFLNFVLLVGTFWYLCEMNKFHIVCDEPGANSTCLHARQTKMVLKALEKWVFWMNPGDKVNECTGNESQQGLLNRERSNWIFYCGTLATIQENR